MRIGRTWMSRLGVVAFTLACTVVVLSRCAIDPSGLVQAGTPTASPASRHPATCAPAAVKPFGCSIYLVRMDPSTLPADSDQRFIDGEAWFEVAARRPQLVIEVDRRRVHVPVTLTADGATTAVTPDSRFAHARCRSDEDCAFRAWLADLFSAPVTVRHDADGFTVRSGAKVLTAASTRRAHRYPGVEFTSLAGRTLLTVPSSGMTAMALVSGPLGTTATGCIAVGSEVLVLPDTARLHSDGSIDFTGRHYRRGGRSAAG